jgi:FkbM family methyltransferase
MRIGRRSIPEFTQRLLDVNNFKAIPAFFRTYDAPVQAILSEVLSLQNYPRHVNLKTPIGKQRIELFSAADFSTLNLIFVRKDYYTPAEMKTVVDIGSNIGLSTFYWLTRNPSCFVYCYEPSPISYHRLLSNLGPWQGRFAAFQAAVSNFKGKVPFYIESSGVYSSLDSLQDGQTSIECDCLHINDVLETILNARSHIDVLKIDSEGHELRTLAAIDLSFWKHISCINTDAKGAGEYIPKIFTYDRVSSAERFYQHTS